MQIRAGAAYSPGTWGAACVRRGHRGATVVVMLALASLAVSCRRSPKTLPESPPDAVQAMAEGLRDHQPQVLWVALPPSYQADIRELIGAFCDHMDPELYDPAFRILAKAVRVMREQEEYLFHSPIALSTPLLESSMGSQWNRTIQVLDAIASSDLSTLESLRRLDPGEFLASTGHRVMAGLDELRKRSQRSPTPSPWERINQALKESRIDFLTSAGTRGVLRFHSTTNAQVREVELSQVEGRWVPSEMAATWKAKVDQARTGLAKLSGPEFEKAKPLLGLVLGTVERAMDSLLEARSQQEFDATLETLTAVGGMLQSLRTTN